MVLLRCVQLNTREYNLRLQTAPAKLYNKSTDISHKRQKQVDMEKLIGETTEYDKKAALEMHFYCSQYYNITPAGTTVEVTTKRAKPRYPSNCGQFSSGTGVLTHYWQHYLSERSDSLSQEKSTNSTTFWTSMLLIE